MFVGLTHAGKPTLFGGKIHMHVNVVPTLSMLNASLSPEMTAAALTCMPSWSTGPSFIWCGLDVGAHLNMMGLIHSLRSPEGILSPKVRV